MAKLSPIGKDYFEQLFGMASGYVLEFSNREFQDFVYSVMSVDIHNKYPHLSKAKILRQIIIEYDEKTVGKLLLELLQFMQYKKLVNDGNIELFNNGVKVGNKLIGKTSSITPSDTLKEETLKKQSSSFLDHEIFLKKLMNLSKLNDTPQSRGFAFEKFLKELFEADGLDPRGSFKVVGEQIDGSFLLFNEVYLLEAKWTNKPSGKSDLVCFNEKIRSKSSFTRGLFISFSGYTEEGLATFGSGRTISVCLMTVQELAMHLESKKSVQDLLWKKIRALAEEGNFNKSIFQI